MKINLEKVKEISLITLSFFIPFVLLIILCNVNGLALNGYKNYTMMMIDMQSEYICYLRDLRQILLHGGSLIYTTEKVFGGDYLSIFTFYLSSPFNLFVVFFKEEAIPLFFIWSSIIKMSFASLNFYLFIRFTDKFRYHKVIFAIGYGFISYSFIYMSNYMWLDGVMILPLVALGLHFLKDKKHYWLYPLAIAYSLMTSWYIGFMICIFAVLYFFYLFTVSFNWKNKEFIPFLMRFAVFSLVGGLLSITYWLVAFIHLSGTKGFSEIPPFEWFTFSSVFSGFLENNYAQANLIRQYRYYISMFVGVVPLVFATTFFFNKEFKYRERIALLVIVFFYLFMSSNTVGAAILHGGKEPTWFPGRYSFIIGFLVCYLGSKGADEAYNLKPYWYAVPLAIGIGGLLLLKAGHHSSFLEKYPISGPSVAMYFVTVGVGLIISLCHYLPIKQLKNEKFQSILPHLLALLVVVQIASIYRGGDKVLRTNVNEQQYQTYETYLKDHAYTSSFDAIKEYAKKNNESPFYRMEATFNRPGNYNQIDNNPMFYSYSGLSNFSSSSKKEVEGYMAKIGFHYNGFFSKYQAGSTYGMNSFLGIKYLLEAKEEKQNIHPYFLDNDTFKQIDINDNNGVKFYENENAINLGFISDKTTSYFINEGVTAESGNTYWFNHFEYQNQIFKSINNSIDKDIYHPLSVSSYTTSIEYEDDEFGIRTYKNVKKGDRITIKYSVPVEAYNFPLYFSEKNYRQDISFYVDSRPMRINTYWNRGIFSFPHNTLHSHTLLIVFNKDFENVEVTPEMYYENLDVLKVYTSGMKENEFVVNKIQNGLTKKAFHGHISIKENANKELIFTLPHEDGIQVYVDGKRVKSMTKFNIFTAIDLSNVKLGDHKITIQYQDNVLVLSLPFFLITLLGFVPLVIFYDKIEKVCIKKIRKRKYSL